MPRRLPADDVHVVHLVPALGRVTSPPEELWLPRRLGRVGRTIFALAVVVASAVAAALIATLWTGETPGWWFSALFTVILGGLAVALWAVFVVSAQEAIRERRLHATWAATRHRARAERGKIVGRDVNLSEDGGVGSFQLTVAAADGVPLTAQWRPRRMSQSSLLQSQVPGVGAEVRLWRVPDHAPGAPVVVEVADPTFVVPAER